MITLSAAKACGWPVMGSYDVVVAGAGPGGVGAATACARSGLKTLLVEKYGFAGGIGTTGCCPLYYGLMVDGQQTTAGISEEVVRLLDGMGEASFMLDNGTWMPEKKPLDGRPLLSKVITRVESMRVAYNRLLQKAGAERLFYATVADAVMADDCTIDALLVSCLEGPALVKGKIFIDATGDASVFHCAGAPTRTYGPESCMHKSLFFTVSGVTAFDKEYNSRLYGELRAQGKTPAGVLDYFGVTHQLNPGTVLIGFGKAIGSGVCSGEMTRMDGELREQVLKIVAFLRREMPGFSACYVNDTAIHVGVRAGRGIVGMKTVDEELIQSECLTPEPVAMIGRAYGSHSNQSAFLPAWRRAGGGLSAIPMGALASPALENALACGRCISADARVMDTFRMMNTCLTTGEAAGLMAAIALDKKKPAAQVPYGMLRPAMEKAGFILPQ